MPPITNKRKVRRCLTIEQKTKILDGLEKGVSPIILARQYNVVKSAITGIKNKRLKIKQAASQLLIGPAKKKNLRVGEYAEMEKKLYKWFLKQRENNVPVSGDILKVQAQNIFQKVYSGGQTFHASEGWLQNFKKRFGIRFIKICGEKLSSQPELVAPFLLKLQQKIKDLDLSHEQIYNADETGLYYKLIPNKTFVSCIEKSAPGRKIAKERVTFLACTNATGRHKLKPLIIGKSKNPRAFRNFKIPLDYDHSKSAWMNTSIFKNWFQKSFIPQVRKHLCDCGYSQKALLLLDNAPSHPPEEELISDDGKISALFLPPNVTALIQPMDQNIIRLTKLYYRNSVMQMVIAQKDRPIHDILKAISMRDVVTLLAQAWDKVQVDTIKKCWKNVLSTPDSNDEFSDEDEIPLARYFQRVHNELSDAAQLSVELIRNLIPEENVNDSSWRELTEDVHSLSTENESSHDSEVEETHATEKTISRAQAVNAINIILQFAAENDAPSEEILVLRKMRERLALSSITNIKQTCIQQFFKSSV